MSDLAIRMENLGKAYQIPHASKSGSAPQGVAEGESSLFTRLLNPLRLARRNGLLPSKEEREEFWALRNVSLDIRQGEVVGFIGRNGAGKSTLLKLLSRITWPTEGSADIYGRVGALLEVGTGFHEELSGRENIYLNGAILGMKKAEIDRKLDEIIAFSGVEKFIDTPVKFYSSGMSVRLAFAVAAHIEPEILVVDEVLAVGDARFQKKCLDRMQEVGAQGRTVLFVTHNMQTVAGLCDRVILLEQGRVIEDGPPAQVIHAYLTAGLDTMASRVWSDPERAPGAEITRLCGVQAVDAGGKIAESVDIRKPVRIEMEYDVLEPGSILLPHFRCYDENGIVLFCSVDLDPEWRLKERPRGRWLSSMEIPGNFLAPGRVTVSATMCTLDPVVLQFDQSDAIAFEVIDSFEADGARGDWVGSLDGVVRPRFEWRTERGE